MGSSKTLLVSATMLIVGVYAISLKSVQTTAMQTAQSQVSRMQSERLVDAAMSVALDDVQKYGPQNKTITGKKALGGTIDYTITKKSSSLAQIDIDVYIGGGKTRHVVAQVEQAKKKSGYRKVHRGDWRVASVFVKKG
ncbi:MAG: hypothetical protein NTZ35_15485 [Ignavibacteriales bacterium]|nr:hypothetical protein [Ignavibacteriales bacterium]